MLAALQADTQNHREWRKSVKLELNDPPFLSPLEFDACYCSPDLVDLCHLSSNISPFLGQKLQLIFFVLRSFLNIWVFVAFCEKRLEQLVGVNANCAQRPVFNCFCATNLRAFQFLPASFSLLSSCQFSAQMFLHADFHFECFCTHILISNVFACIIFFYVFFNICKHILSFLESDHFSAMDILLTSVVVENSF